MDSRKGLTAAIAAVLVTRAQTKGILSNSKIKEVKKAEDWKKNK